MQGRIQNPVEHLQWSFFAKITKNTIVDAGLGSKCVSGFTAEKVYRSHYLSDIVKAVPLSANFDDSLPPLATGIPKLQNDIFEIWRS